MDSLALKQVYAIIRPPTFFVNQLFQVPDFALLSSERNLGGQGFAEEISKRMLKMKYKHIDLGSKADEESVVQ